MIKLKNYWYLIALSVVTSILASHFFIFFYLLVFWLFYLYYFRKINIAVLTVSIFAFFFYFYYIPSLELPPEEIESAMPQIFTGKITGPVTSTNKKIEFTFQDQHTNDSHLVLHFIEDNKETPMKDINPLQYGAICHIKGSLTVPEKARNPYQFNYQSYLLKKGIS